MSRGIVYLVGAGPGDPGLLTMRAAELLRSAEVLAYDQLIPAPILALAPASAERLPVGRRRGDARTTFAIHPEVLARAHAGRRVVRLKAGDPFVFGRGAEEAEALADAGIPFEVVPGITAAVGAAAYAGIPLTDRRHASSVTLTTGHAGLADTMRSASSRSTVVLYMAGHQLSQNLAHLIAQGRAADTPAAYVAYATQRDQEVILGTLSTLAGQVGEREGAGPAVVIVGDVVRLRRKSAWLERRPLAGRHVIVARARPGESQIAKELRGLGAEVTEAPQVHVAPLASHAFLDAAIAELARYAALLFACEAGVDAILDRLSTLGLARSRLNAVPLVAIGPGAADRLRRHGLSPRIAVKGSCVDELARHVPRLRLGPVLVVTADRGRPGLLSDLAGMGVKAEPLPAYQLAPSHVPLPDLVDAVVLPSSTAAEGLLDQGANAGLLGVPMLAMGPRTLDAAVRRGARQVAKALRDTPTSLVAATLALLAPNAAQHSVRATSVLPADGERPERPA